MLRNSEVRSLALFDFDNTITSRDTLFDFHLFTFGMRKTSIALWASCPHILSSSIGLLDPQKAKERFLSIFWKNVQRHSFQKSCIRYTNERLNSIIREEAIQAIRYHQKREDYIVVVTASIREWVEPWCSVNGINYVIASEMEKLDGSLTGSLKGKNCKGPEKVSRIRKELELSCFQRIYAYGDSSGDREMLELAHEKYYRWKRLS